MNANQLGYKARMDGVAIDKNPYTPNKTQLWAMTARQNWYSGWLMADTLLKNKKVR